MASKETSLGKVTSLAGTDLIRAIADGSSSNITLTKLIAVVDPLLVALGFLKNGSLPASILNVHTVRGIIAGTSNHELTDDILECNPGAGQVNINLLQASTYPAQRAYIFKRISATASNVVITPYAGDSIDGQPSLTLLGGTYAWATLYVSGNRWQQIV